jgi:integrase/recombinase XerD
MGACPVHRYPPALPRVLWQQTPFVKRYNKSRGPSKISDTKYEITLYDSTMTGELNRPDEPFSPRNAPAIVKAAEFAWEEFFQAEIANAQTRKNSMHAVRQFLAWIEPRNLELPRISPGDVGEYLQGLERAVPTKKLHLAALRRLFDRLVNRHACVINPAATVKAERHSVVEGKTPDIGPTQARALLKSIAVADPIGLRDRAVLAVLAYTAARVGAVAKPTMKNFVGAGSRYTLRFAEKGGKNREIPVRHDLEQLLLDYIRSANVADGPLFRTANRKSKTLTTNAMTGIDICRMMKTTLEGGGPAGALLATIVPGDDLDRPSGAERAAGGRAVPGRARRPADHADLRPSEAEGHPEHRRTNLDLIEVDSIAKSESIVDH